MCVTSNFFAALTSYGMDGRNGKDVYDLQAFMSSDNETWLYDCSVGVDVRVANTVRQHNTISIQFGFNHLERQPLVDVRRQCLFGFGHFCISKRHVFQKNLFHSHLDVNMNAVYKSKTDT